MIICNCTTNGLKGQQAISPRHRLGYEYVEYMRPVRAKAINSNAFALTGRVTHGAHIPRALPWAKGGLPFQGVLFGAYKPRALPWAKGVLFGCTIADNHLN